MTNLLVKGPFLLALVALTISTFLWATALGNNAHHLHSTYSLYNLSSFR